MSGKSVPDTSKKARPSVAELLQRNVDKGNPLEASKQQIERLQARVDELEEGLSTYIGYTSGTLKENSDEWMGGLAAARNKICPLFGDKAGWYYDGFKITND